MTSFREKFAPRLRLPLIAAPMLRVSGPELVIAASRAGVVGAFPTANAGSPDELDAWLRKIRADLAATPGFGAPVCPNLIIRHSSLAEQLENRQHIRRYDNPATTSPNMRFTLVATVLALITVALALPTDLGSSMLCY